jgi:vacuolar protein sorting-associated protein VTA1
LAASLFLEVLRVFGDLDQETQDKIKYAKFKAADIIKALKEGRVPMPGPPGGDDSLEVAGDHGAVNTEEQAPPPDSSDQMATAWSERQSPALDDQFQDLSLKPGQVLPSHLAHHAPSASSPLPHAQPSPESRPSPSQISPQIFASGHLGSHSAPVPSTSTRDDAHSATSASPAVTGESPYDYKVLNQAQKHAKFAISALQYDDIKSAMENLRKAMELLSQYE